LSCALAVAARRRTSSSGLAVATGGWLRQALTTTIRRPTSSCSLGVATSHWTSCFALRNHWTSGVIERSCHSYCILRVSSSALVTTMRPPMSPSSLGVVAGHWASSCALRNNWTSGVVKRICHSCCTLQVSSSMLATTIRTPTSSSSLGIAAGHWTSSCAPRNHKTSGVAEPAFRCRTTSRVHAVARRR